MASTSLFVPLSRTSRVASPAPATFPARYARWRSLHALEAVQRVTGLQDRVTTMLRSRRPSPSLTFGSLVAAQVSAWRTAAELRSHDDRQLADIEIPREMIGSVATLSAFGVPAVADMPKSARRASGGLWSQLRRSFFPTQEELEETYLAASVDLHDLESRMAELDRRRVSPLHL